jgi:hypothetical protein
MCAGGLKHSRKIKWHDINVIIFVVFLCVKTFFPFLTLYMNIPVTFINNNDDNDNTVLVFHFHSIDCRCLKTGC